MGLRLKEAFAGGGGRRRRQDNFARGVSLVDNPRKRFSFFFLIKNKGKKIQTFFHFFFKGKMGGLKK